MLPQGEASIEILHGRLQLRGRRGLSHPGRVGLRAAADAAGDAEPSAETAVAQTPRFVVEEVGRDVDG